MVDSIPIGNSEKLYFLEVLGFKQSIVDSDCLWVMFLRLAQAKILQRCQFFFSCKSFSIKHQRSFLSLSRSDVIIICLRYREVDANDTQVLWLWNTLESFTNEERILFMRFVSGRSRLPANVTDVSQRFQIVKVDRVSIKRNLFYAKG